VTLFAGNPAITGWAITQGNLDYMNLLWQSADGTHNLDMNGCVPGTIKQALSTVSGQTYRVTFALAGNPAFPSFPIKTLTAAAAGTTASFKFDTTGKSFTNMGWVDKSFDFTATGTSTNLSFAGDPLASCWGPALDHVRVTVPDSDGDGVLDDADACPSTPAGSTVNAGGCSIAQLAPCAGPWKNHGNYVSAVAHQVEAFVAAGLITAAEGEAIQSAAARSDCGRKAKK
jgi:choice-of-anchor C domain-containing protein